MSVPRTQAAWDKQRAEVKAKAAEKVAEDTRLATLAKIAALQGDLGIEPTPLTPAGEGTEGTDNASTTGQPEVTGQTGTPSQAPVEPLPVTEKTGETPAA